MPIFDPSMQLSLCGNRHMYKNKVKPSVYNSTFIKSLLRASANMNRNISTIEASIQFKIDLIESISVINLIFGCNFSLSKDFDNPTITDYFKYFYDRINQQYKNDSNLCKSEGIYFQLRYEKNNYKAKFFRPFISHNTNRIWLFTDSPIAVLCINDTDIALDKFKDLIKLINLEIDVYKALGYTLVLCAFCITSIDIANEILLYILKTHNFSEIHFNIDLKESLNYLSFLKTFSSVYNKMNGYFYLYSLFQEVENAEINSILKELKKKPRFINITYSNELDSVEKYNIVSINPFVYCETGFIIDKIRIHLCNVPLYNSSDIQNDFITSQLSGYTMAYISPDDFISWNQPRVYTLVRIVKDEEEEEEDNKITEYVYKFIDFNDIHVVKSEFFVYDSLNLINIKKDELEKANNIESKYYHISYSSEPNQNFEKKLSKEQKIEKLLSYLSYIYSQQFELKTGVRFEIHLNQIYAAYEACSICIQNLKKSEYKGVVFQLDTGEGKSCTIIIIAAALALKKKTVHIASSNILLSIRDYAESLDFFKSIGLQSAVLLHKNELDSHNNKELYPDTFFRDELFNNKSNMNFSVCGINDDNQINKNKADIIFSTFVHLENLYLRIMEMCPGILKTFFGNCSLLIDEADSILIDDLTTGTILSRSIKSNCSTVLKYVYKCWLEKRKPEDVCDDIKKQWPKCKDIQKEDIEVMYKEILLVNQPDFINGKRYSIEDIKIKDNRNIIQKGIDLINNVNETIDKYKVKIAEKIVYGQLSQENDTNNDQPKKQIIPFDSSNKGILERNKEFSGFIQQFIAIKEMLNNSESEEILIKENSINYLYISHPIFVKLYNGICGFTGTIGNKFDREILQNQYHLQTKKIPRNNLNFRVEFPILLSKNIRDRNEKIVSEIISFHKIGYPVLVIFKDLNEINAVKELLLKNNISDVNVFEGRNENLKPEEVAGYDEAISLGTNVCGRGTNIQSHKPLHVIVTYYSSNIRSMYQAYGRTARQGRKGSVHVICTFDQYISPREKYKDEDLSSVLDEFKIKNKFQGEFINKFKKNRSWIFDPYINKQDISENNIYEMRCSKINVNRIKAYNFEYPICMSISTFLEIQAQKIYSLYNCPNCKYAWMIFQQYVREMILESWSLFINKIERDSSLKKINKSFYEYMQSERENLYKQLSIYLPDSDTEQVDIITTFIHIFNYVRSKYEKAILKSFPCNVSEYFKQYDKKNCTFSIGFRPYSLIDESGSRINTVGNQSNSQNYIKDPELKYYKKQPDGKLTLLSITEKIDDIFDWMCQKINSKIGSFIGLKFFMRRTLGGCEFGVCFDFELENIDKELINDHNCLVDKDSLLLFAISVKSKIPLLAGFLIFWAIYIGSVIKTIGEYITAFAAKVGQKIVSTLKELATTLGYNLLYRCSEKICSFLQNLLDQQISKMNELDSKVANIFTILKRIIAPQDFSSVIDIGENIFKMFTGSYFLKKNLPMNNFLKIGFLLMLCFASFMMLFKINHQKIDYQKTAAKFDKSNNLQASISANKKYVKLDQTNTNNNNSNP